MEYGERTDLIAKHVPPLVQRAMAPGFSFCFRCGRPWKFVKGHTTYYSESRGCFPLCEGCWHDLGTPEARLPFYRILWLRWCEDGGDMSDAPWEDIEAAVRAGL